MTNVNVTATEIAPLGGSTNAGLKLGFIDSVSKAAQNDTITVTNASSVSLYLGNDDSAGTVEVPTISGNVVTLTSAATEATSALIVYKPA